MVIFCSLEQINYRVQSDEFALIDVFTFIKVVFFRAVAIFGNVDFKLYLMKVSIKMNLHTIHGS